LLALLSACSHLSLFVALFVEYSFKDAWCPIWILRIVERGRRS
jgi:hypothetical protein